jgi:parallel beta-helix repeat protein
MTKITKAVVVLAGIAAASRPGLAAEGRIPVFAPGTVLAADGKYIVTRNISAAAAPIITIAAGNVDLDLNGFTLSAPGGGGDLIVVPGPAVEVRIHNGTLVGGSTSINAPGPGRQLIVEDVKSQDAAGGTAAIHTVDVESVAYRRITFQDPGTTWAISMDGGFPAKTGTIEANIIRGGAAGTGGINVVAGSAMAVLHNHLENMPGGGLSLDCNGCLVSENTIQDSGGNGIEVRQGKGGKLYDNVVSRGGSNGIVLGAGVSDTLVMNNVLTGNGADGLLVNGTQNHIERNTMNTNSSCGMRLNGANNVFGRNMARGNAGIGCAPCAGAPGAPPNSCNNAAGNTSHADNFMTGLL